MAATAHSYYDVRPLRGRWLVDLVTPRGRRSSRLTLEVFGGLDRAVAYAREAGKRAKRQVKLPRGVA